MKGPGGLRFRGPEWEVSPQYLELAPRAEVTHFLHHVLLEEGVRQGLFCRAAVLGAHHQEAGNLRKTRWNGGRVRPGSLPQQAPPSLPPLRPPPPPDSDSDTDTGLAPRLSPGASTPGFSPSPSRCPSNRPIPVSQTGSCHS